MAATIDVPAFPKLKEAQERLDAKRQELHTIFSEAGPDLDMDKVKSIPGDSAAKVEEIRKRNAELDDLTDEVARLTDVAKAAGRVLGGAVSGEGDPADPVARPAPTKATPSRKSIGELFVESEAFKGYSRGASQGPIVHLDIDLKTLFSTTAGWDPEETRGLRTELLATRPAPHVVDAIPQTETSQTAVKYMEETTFTNNAAEAAEGATYGEAALALTEKTADVRKIAVWIPVTDEQFEDEPRARDYVNNRLEFMLRQRLDAQVLTGNGTAPNLRGTENVSGIQTQAIGTDVIFDAAYKLFRKIREDGFAEPSAFFITPAKWETARLARTADGIYILGNPADPGPSRLWGVPGIETTAAPSTKLVAGDYRNFSELAVRRGVDIQVTNAHSDFFINGKLAVRADVRVALIHYRPKAFGVVTGL